MRTLNENVKELVGDASVSEMSEFIALNAIKDLDIAGLERVKRTIDLILAEKTNA